MHRAKIIIPTLLREVCEDGESRTSIFQWNTGGMTYAEKTDLFCDFPEESIALIAVSLSIRDTVCDPII
jgi:hypothetical protein